MDTLKLSVSGTLKQKLQYIDSHDFDSVKNKVRVDFEEQGRHVTNDYLNGGILALKQYYALTILDGRNMHAVSDSLDPFWHAHILHTEDYVAFCDKIAGCYLHHDPLDHADERKVETLMKMYAVTRNRYGDCFKDVDARFHPVNPARERIVCGGNGQDISFSIFAQAESRYQLPHIFLPA